MTTETHENLGPGSNTYRLTHVFDYSCTVCVHSSLIYSFSYRVLCQTMSCDGGHFEFWICTQTHIVKRSFTQYQTPNIRVLIEQESFEICSSNHIIGFCVHVEFWLGTKITNSEDLVTHG